MVTKTSTDFNRAQLAAQSSHRFLMKSMDAMNTGVKGALKGAVMDGIAGVLTRAGNGTYTLLIF